MSRNKMRKPPASAGQKSLRRKIGEALEGASFTEAGKAAARAVGGYEKPKKTGKASVRMPIPKRGETITEEYGKGGKVKRTVTSKAKSKKGKRGGR